MDRRAFFTRGAGKAAKVVAKHAVEKAHKNASRWIRPPFAIDELDFLLACNRCGDCTQACPHEVIFPLHSKLGVSVFATPAMNLLNQACHLCADWPCVEVCEKGALKIPVPAVENNEEGDINASTVDKSIDDENNVDAQEEQKPLPKIATVSINIDTCLPYNGPECGACRVCPVDGAMIWTMEKPSINMEFCTGCALCREACILDVKAINVQSKYKS